MIKSLQQNGRRFRSFGKGTAIGIEAARVPGPDQCGSMLVSAVERAAGLFSGFVPALEMAQVFLWSPPSAAACLRLALLRLYSMIQDMEA